MLNLFFGNNTFLFTLKEKQTLTTPNYVFKFTHQVTNEIVMVFKKNAADTSQYKDRYNLFTFASTDFTTFGQYNYEVYEVSGNTTDVDGANMLENGIMIYHEDKECYTTHTTCNEYITRG